MVSTPFAKLFGEIFPPRYLDVAVACVTFCENVTRAGGHFLWPGLNTQNIERDLCPEAIIVQPPPNTLFQATIETHAHNIEANTPRMIETHTQH